MLHATELIVYALAVLVMVMTPGPNMLYCVSRTLCQGISAGLVSVAGVQVGSVIHMVGASAGLSALLMTVPLAFDVIKLAGASYLLVLAWQAVKPGGASLFQTRDLPIDSAGKLFRVGLMTMLTNPKVVVFYLSIFPQFLAPERGNLLLQTLQLGVVHISVSTAANSMIVLGASRITHFLQRSPRWVLAQRYVMGSVLAGLALRIAMTEKK